jgi:hypothetical protein
MGDDSNLPFDHHFSQVPAVFVNVQAFAHDHHLSVFHTDFRGHVFFEQLDACQV